MPNETVGININYNFLSNSLTAEGHATGELDADEIYVVTSVTVNDEEETVFMEADIVNIKSMLN